MLSDCINITVAVVVVIVWSLDLQLSVQSVPVITKVVWSNSVHGKVYSIQHYQWQAIGRLFSLGTPVSSTNTTDRNDITEMLLKVALNTINQTKSTHKYYHNELLNLLLLWKRFNSDSINIKKRIITSLLNKLNTKRPW